MMDVAALQPVAFALGEEIHIRSVQLRGSDEHVARCSVAASVQESQRAEQFRFQHLRRAFLLAHGSARALLAQYLGISGAEIEFKYKSRGKPYIGSPHTHLCFNQSHSGEMAVFAFAAGCEVGVDVEAVHSLPDMDDLAAHFFSREEAADLFSVPIGSRDQAFFAAWTRKEAYIKAVGDGLHIPLDSFRVTLLPGEDARLVHIGGDAQAAGAWRMHAFHPAEGYLGALAYAGRGRNVRLFPAMEASALLDSPAVKRARHCRERETEGIGETPG